MSLFLNEIPLANFIALKKATTIVTVFNVKLKIRFRTETYMKAKYKIL